MREIKFRAWSTFNKPRMDYLNYADFDGNDLVETRQWKVMQYTGLLDANGVEIYEGDLYKDVFGNVGEVVFTTMTEPTVFGSGFIGERISDRLRMPLSSRDKVIGNIHANPELLGG